MKTGKYIKHDDMWCPVSREHRDPALQANHVAAVKASGQKTPETKKPSYRSEAAKKRHEGAEEWRKNQFKRKDIKLNNDHEAKVDNEIAKLHAEVGTAKLAYQRALDAVHYAVRDKKDKNGNWGMNSPEVQEKFEAAERLSGYSADAKDRLKSAIKDARNTLDETLTKYREAEKQYGGWSRFFLVNQPNGHIHKSMHCPTCKGDTQFAWLPDLSGLEEGDAVKAHGPRLCSHCYPTAPAEWTEGIKKDKEGLCEGSGQYYNGPWQNRYAKCPSCGAHVSVTRGNAGGKYRSHKPLSEDEKKVSEGLDKYRADDLAWKLRDKGAKVRVHETVGKKKLYAVDVAGKSITTRTEAKEHGVR